MKICEICGAEQTTEEEQNPAERYLGVCEECMQTMQDGQHYR
ncbi:hypothetical protein [Brevibacillus fulvus]|uniref:Ribosome-binding protein aMBF1 (Putative translation factor) n=1 Tax=Brevibacillus fulvus TaxID=1125967 RepID=A0A938XXT5_9BACL|nr:hypothetical protein [Brevibacillus fulvus]MBM7588914.1 ribosome-binding protein aMBF1 (putative translation factor) [Brevibacillus fulvus]